MFKEIFDPRVLGKNRACFLAWKLKRKIAGVLAAVCRGEVSLPLAAWGTCWDGGSVCNHPISQMGKLRQSRASAYT